MPFNQVELTFKTFRMKYVLLKGVKISFQNSDFLSTLTDGFSFFELKFVCLIIFNVYIVHLCTNM